MKYKSLYLRFVLLTIERRLPRGIKIVPAKLHETVVIGQVDDITDEGALDAEHVLASPRLEQVQTHSGGRVRPLALEFYLNLAWLFCNSSTQI